MASNALRAVSSQASATEAGGSPDILVVHDGSGLDRLVLPALRQTYTVNPINL